METSTTWRGGAGGPESFTVEAIASVVWYADAATANFASVLLRLGEEPWWTYAWTGMVESIR